MLELATEINSEYAAMTSDVESSLRHAWTCGHRLTEAKQSIGAGQWESWVQNNCTFSIRWAQKLMRFTRLNPQIDGQTNLSSLGYTSIQGVLESLQNDGAKQHKQAVEFLSRFRGGEPTACGIKHAKNILKHGSEELIALVGEGRVAAIHAFNVSRFPHAEQIGRLNGQVLWTIPDDLPQHEILRNVCEAERLRRRGSSTPDAIASQSLTAVEWNSGRTIMASENSKLISAVCGGDLALTSAARLCKATDEEIVTAIETGAMKAWKRNTGVSATATTKDKHMLLASLLRKISSDLQGFRLSQCSSMKWLERQTDEQKADIVSAMNKANKEWGKIISLIQGAKDV